MNPKVILQELKGNESLRSFINAFHARLANDNQRREESTNLTDNERFMDHVGRLLVGDEVCAAIAIQDGCIYVSSNTSRHTSAQLTCEILEREIVSGEKHDPIQIFATAVAHVSYEENENERSIRKRLEFGRYSYNRTTNQLIAESESVEFTLTPEEHGVIDYPFPISFRFILEKEIQGPPHKLVPHITINIPVDPPKHRVRATTRLDPLFRRSASLFSHLGLLAKHKSCHFPLGQKSRLRLISAVKKSRVRVLSQTSTWEVAKRFKLKDTLRDYRLTQVGLAGIPKRDQVNIGKKQTKLKQLYGFVEKAAEALNKHFVKKGFLLSLDDETLMHWKETFSKSIESETPGWLKSQLTPGRLETQLDKFFEIFLLHVRSLSFAEHYIISISRTNPLIQTLADVGEYETLRDGCGEKLKLINDESLAEGTHAEIRLFHELMIKQQLRPRQISYFGITQLCCACCNSLFKHHGLNYHEGRPNRTGTHATHYPAWRLSEPLRIEKVLQPFFGQKLFQIYSELGPEDQVKACDIIEDLASLWFGADDSQLDRVEALGLPRTQIKDANGNYASFLRMQAAEEPTAKKGYKKVNSVAVGTHQEGLFGSTKSKTDNSGNKGNKPAIK